MNAAVGPTLPPGDPTRGHVLEARRLARAGVVVLVAGLLPAAAWLAFAPLSSAVVAGGYVKVDQDRRQVQHVEGGIVREVRVRDGQHVQHGDTLLVLGDVAVDADRNRLAFRVDAERAGIARLESEVALSPAIAYPPDLLAAARADPRLAELIAKERALFGARRDTLLGQVALLRTQREKVAQEIVALRAQIEQAQEALKHQKAELETNRGLQKDGFISATRIAQLESGVADYGVKLEERRGELARAGQRAVDTDLRIRALESDYRQQATDQLKAVSARLAEIEQEQRKSSDASSRQAIVAPASGQIIGLKYATPGAVIAPRDTIAEIVPDGAPLVTEARIRTEDINRVAPGHAADIRFTAFKYRSTPLVHAKVTYVAADRMVDRASNLPYYAVLVEADPGSLAKAGELKLQAGMPAEVYIQGEERTPLQYLLEPLTQVLRRAAREQ